MNGVQGTLATALAAKVKGEVAADEATRAYYARDASLFEITPEAVVFPNDAEDVKALVRFATEQKQKGEEISLTARGGGSCMSGGPLTESVVLDMTRHMNRVLEVGDRINQDGGAPPASAEVSAGKEGYAIAEPGCFYRDFEKATLAKGYFMPAYPASREMAALGGMVANDAAGEKTLKYGKVHNFVTGLKVVLSDGNEYEVEPLSAAELVAKEKLGTFEGGIYRKLHALVETNYEKVKAAKPKVSKNSAGYNLWDVWDRKTFDLTKLFTGSQGTLGITTEITFRLVKPKAHSGMLVLFLKDLAPLADIIRTVLTFKPSSVESFDRYTFSLALKHFWGFFKLFARNPFSLLLAFAPEALTVLFRGAPLFIVMVEFEEASAEEVAEKLGALARALPPFRGTIRTLKNARASKKFWIIRRESFNLLRHKVRGLQTAPFIDDIVVNPEHLSLFLPELYTILNRYGFIATVAGHVGEGNFHVIPLMRLADEAERAKIRPAMDEVYALVLRYGGSITGEHNDGLIRSPYLPQMFGDDVYALFVEAKHIFDPLNIFNPGKKVGADMAYAFAHLKRS
ncbi:MAG: FAD-binding oxidoreductase [Candidatus Jorgensenbacteria bacterium]|nr:FAD-binding oxidoreductase [Candidatus Jorgensenbacteria bacterium]